MKLLVDTHVWLWWHMRPERIAAEALALIEDTRHSVFLSVVTTWEVALKRPLGKLRLPAPLDTMVSESLLADGMQALLLDHRHCFELDRLPLHHRDPFDRMLIAQARVEKMSFVTADETLAGYDVPVIRAG